MRFYDLNLTRYDVQDPPVSSLLRPSPIPGYQLSSSSPRIPSFYYRIDDPELAVGPGDDLPAVVNFVFDPRSPKVQPQSISVVLERRLDLFEASGSPTPPEILSGTASPYPSSSEASSTVSLSSTACSQHQLSRKRSISPPSNFTLPSKTISSTIASAHSSEFHCHAPDQFKCVVPLSLPAKPPPSQWPVGESLKTALAQLRFELRVKVKSLPSCPCLVDILQQVTLASSSGPVEVTLEPTEIRLAPLSQEQRSTAREKIAKKKASRSKSAPSSRRASPSPSTSGSSKAGPETPPLPTPGPSPLLETGTFGERFPPMATTSQDHDRAMRKPRPMSKHRSQATLTLSIPPTRQRSASNVYPSAIKSSGGSSSANSSAGSSSASTSTATITSFTKSLGVTTPTTSLKRMPSQAVRAWEEELERISMRSKRQSDDMLGAGGGGGGGSASDVERSTRSIRGTRTRRGTVNGLMSAPLPPPPSAYIQSLVDRYPHSPPFKS